MADDIAVTTLRAEAEHLEKEAVRFESDAAIQDAVIAEERTRSIVTITAMEIETRHERAREMMVIANSYRRRAWIARNKAATLRETIARLEVPN